jgi:NAD(P)-dependent dehydrogenase (short-subunit alcohol dehydrogenase family)
MNERVRTIAVTGAASGIGAAVRMLLSAEGARVIGVDQRDADVVADLSCEAGRVTAIGAVEEACAGVLDGLVTCAGIGSGFDEAAKIQVNYFGTVGLLAGLRPSLARAPSPAVVAVASNAMTAVPGIPAALVDACLAGDEDRACALAGEHPGYGYAASKLAVARFVRRQAPTREWAGAGIILNAVAPGATRTPLLQASLDDPVLGPAVRAFPVPVGRFATADEIAAAIGFLLGPGARFICGSILFVDGGSDAFLRPDDAPSTYAASEDILARLTSARR